MLGETPIHLVGNLTADPELRYTPNGVPVATFTVASTERAMNRESGKYEDAGTLFLRCNVWREQAENLVNSANKGNRVVVVGTLKQRPWETKEGEKRTSYEVQAEEVAVSLRWATVKISKTARSGGPAPEDPWAKAPAAVGADAHGPEVTDEPPF
jgi:single-strand DNA-binding protein